MSETSRNDHVRLTEGRTLAKNIAWNLAGSLLPIVAALIATPFLIGALGLERFGVLALIVAVIGYFGLFDLGLGRALTKLLAERLGNGRQDGIGALAGTALLAMLGLGLVGAALTAAATPWLVGSFLEIPERLRDETASAFFVLAYTVPLFTVTVGLRAVLESFQRFRTVNIVRIPVSIFFFFGPLAVLAFADSLVAVVLVLAAGRLVEFAVYLRVGFKLLAGRGSRMAVDAGVLAPLLRFSGWLAVSSVIGPVMIYFDRFLIGNLISLEAVTYYTTPYDVVTRLLIIPSAFLGVLFPAMATAMAAERAHGARLVMRGVNSVLVALAPAALILLPFASPLLGLWLGSAFAENSAVALQWLSVGVMVNALAFVPFAFIQAAGRPDLTAKLHMLEVLPYLALLWWLANALGITGVAIAWTIRIVVDTSILFYMAGRFAPETRAVAVRAFLVLGVVLAVSAIGILIDDLKLRIVYAVCGLTVYLPLVWFVILQPEEREFFVQYFRPVG